MASPTAGGLIRPRCDLREPIGAKCALRRRGRRVSGDDAVEVVGVAGGFHEVFTSTRRATPEVREGGRIAVVGIDDYLDATDNT
jgi:hypothetical protein